MKKLIVLFLCLVVLTSCSNNRNKQANENLLDEIENLKQEVQILTSKIIEIDEERNMYKLESINRDLRIVESNLFMQQYLMKNNPQLEIRLAYVEDELEGNQLKVQYYEFIEDEEEPVGYRYEEREMGKIQLKQNLWIYVLREFTFYEPIMLSDLRKELIEERKPFMELYFIDGVVIMMREIYLP